MVTSLSKLMELIQGGAVPAWLRDEVLARREQMEKDLREKGVYTFTGPDGEKIELRAQKAAAA